MQKKNQAMINALEGAAAMCDLLHAHAQGQTDLTEEQLASVVTGVSRQARDALRGARGGGAGAIALMAPGQARWVSRARRWGALHPVRLDG